VNADQSRQLNVLAERLLTAVPLPRDELLVRLQDPSEDTSRLSFATGVLLGIGVGIVVALGFILRAGRSDEHQRDTTLELRA
jgi:uncharacterized membrane protein